MYKIHLNYGYLLTGHNNKIQHEYNPCQPPTTIQMKKNTVQYTTGRSITNNKRLNGHPGD